MKKLLLSVSLAYLVLSGCGGEDDYLYQPYHGTVETDRDSIVAGNCRIVQSAAEEFASLNNGVYPSDVDTDAAPDGSTLIDLLPGGCMLENPYTHKATEPANRCAHLQGEIGCVSICGGGWCVGYIITGFGSDSLVASLSNIGSPEEAAVRANCLIVRQAVEDYIAVHGSH